MAFACPIEPVGNEVTILTGEVADQAELRGIVTRLWDLNLTLISLQTLDASADAVGHNRQGLRRREASGGVRPHTDSDGGAQQ